MDRWSIWYRMGVWVRDLLFPPICVGCGRTLPPARPEAGIFCSGCRDAWEKDCEEARLSMGGLLPDALAVGGCSRHIFLTGYHPGREQGVSEKLIYHMKHTDDSRTFEFVVKALIPYVVEAFPDLRFDRIWFAYAPRRRRAVVTYGVDQSEKIAKELARICGGTFVPLLERRGGREQKKLTAAERKENVATVFSLKDEYRDAVVGKTIVLVDDLLTTGATLGLCASILASAGASEVVALTVASTMERDEETRRQTGKGRTKRKKKR